MFFFALLPAIFFSEDGLLLAFSDLCATQFDCNAFYPEFFHSHFFITIIIIRLVFVSLLCARVCAFAKIFAIQ